MKKKRINIFKRSTGILSLLLFFVACENPMELKGKKIVTESSLSDFYNTNKSLVYEENPIVLSGSNNITYGRFSDFDLAAAFITTNTELKKKCEFSIPYSSVTEENCFKVLLNKDPSSTPLQSVNGSWNYPVDSQEFIEVNTFYHVNKLVTEFLKMLESSNYAVDIGLNKQFWLRENDLAKTLTAYAKCDITPMNAYFSPAENELCLGWNKDYSKYNFYMAQDPGVIYHELGHALVKIMMNEKNANISSSSYLGSLFYDEGGAINEGLADYIKYFMQGGSKVGEWAMGRFFNQARPLRENDSLHKVNVAETYDKRLSYPDFLQYDPNEPEKNFEDVHYAGQIVSHFFVALTEKLKNSCYFSPNAPYSRVSPLHDQATELVLSIINDSLADLGNISTPNPISPWPQTDPEEAYHWAEVVNPPNMRQFFKKIAETTLNKTHLLCFDFGTDDLESLLDSYGLLLFKKYSSGIFAGDPVNELNRKKSVLISKDLISLNSDSIAYVFDSKSAIDAMLANLTYDGTNVSTSTGLASTEYNNNEINISPGEIVGVSLNLINNSNSTISGVQILANDFDHMKLTEDQYGTIKPYVPRNENRGVHAGSIAKHRVCAIDGFPLESEDGAGYHEDTSLRINDLCKNTTTNNKKFSATGVYAYDSPEPVCFVQKAESNENIWVSQNTFREAKQIEDNECLNNPSMSGDRFNPNECLIRFLPGANQAVLSKIDPGKTWAETLKGDSGVAPIFNQSALLLMEVNKNTPPGTVFNCRMRVRFSNCKDCYTKADGSSYSESEFAGHEPFKVINFKFMVSP